MDKLLNNNLTIYFLILPTTIKAVWPPNHTIFSVVSLQLNGEYCELFLWVSLWLLSYSHDRMWMVCHFAWGNIRVSHGWKNKQREPKHVLLPRFSCLIVHARRVLYAFVNPESLGLNWTIVQLNCDLKETLPVNNTTYCSPFRVLVYFLFWLASTQILSSHRDLNEPDVQHCKGNKPSDNCRDDNVPEGQ